MGGGFCIASSGYAGTTHRPCNACTAHVTGLATECGTTCSLYCICNNVAAIRCGAFIIATEPVHAASRQAPSTGHATERGATSSLHCIFNNAAAICCDTFITATESTASRRMDPMSELL
jgi:hypothetical protein